MNDVEYEKFKTFWHSITLEQITTEPFHPHLKSEIYTLTIVTPLRTKAPANGLIKPPSNRNRLTKPPMPSIQALCEQRSVHSAEKS